jgi:outer membrane protein
MRMRKFSPAKRTILVAWLFCIMFGTVSAAMAEDSKERIRQTIDQRFPGAAITEIRRDTWEGQSVTEVEFTSRSGVDYEAVISDTQEILNLEEEKGLPLIGGELSLGLGVTMERDIYRGTGSEMEPTPFLLYENGPFEIRRGDGIDATYRFLETETFSVSLLGRLEIEGGYDPADSEYLRGMDELGSLFGAGLALEKEVGGWEAGLEILQDASGEHNGQQAELSLGRSWTFAGFEWRPELSATWLSKKTVDYLYGVSSREARPDRPAYSPGSSYEFGAELMIQRPLFGNFSFVGIVEAVTLGKEVKDSPLVDRDYELWSVFGLMYTF